MTNSLLSDTALESISGGYYYDRMNDEEKATYNYLSAIVPASEIDENLMYYFRVNQGDSMYDALSYVANNNLYRRNKTSESEYDHFMEVLNGNI